MDFNFPAIFLFFSVLLASRTISSDALPHFFPNVSSIPKSLIPNTTAGAWETFHDLAGCHSGQKNVSGLSKLKSYFQYFGYIANTSQTFSDDFDASFEDAIRTYQTNFNLNVTGALDEPTVNQIMRPRCGVADIVNGSSSMNSGKAAALHGHTVAHYSFFPGTPRWPAGQTDLTYAFLPENQVSDRVRQVFATAFERWSEVTPLTFTEISNYRSADIRIGFVTGDHGDGEPFDGVLGTLAHAFSPPNGRLHLDGDETWVTDNIRESASNVAVDLESVAVHEIGHLLGLGHSSVAEAIMFPTISSGMRKVELADDDVQGITQLYGTNPNYTGPNTTFGERETDTSRAQLVGPVIGHVLFVAVGLLLFFAL